MTARALRPRDAARDGKCITIVVGAERTEYKVHKALLEDYSEYFKRALNGEWDEARSGVIHLEDVECGTFELFVDWLYMQSLPKWADLIPDTCLCHDDSDFHCVVRTGELRWLSLYVFGDRFQIREIKEAVLRKQFDAHHLVALPPYHQVVIYAFANLPSEDIMLKLLVDLHCRYPKSEEEDAWEFADRMQLPYDFLFRVMQRYSKVIRLGVANEPLNATDYELKDGPDAN